MSARIGRMTGAEDQVGRWLSAVLGERGEPGPFRLHRLDGGNSNVTDLVESATGRWVLRRPPAATISATANNLAREHRVLAALTGLPVLTPAVVAYADDPAVVPVPCLLMEFVDGCPLTTAWPAHWNVAEGSLRALGLSAVDALADVHLVGWRAAGLEGFGRPDGYLRRQVARWRGQYEQHQVRGLPLFGRLAGWLEDNRPEETEPALLHGDFHLDNCLFVPGPPVHTGAIIDWELSTIGDPLMDLGLLLAFWGPDRADRPGMPRVQALTRHPDAPTRAELAAHYAARTGRRVDRLDFYMALALFKLAAIVEGAYAAYVDGRVDSPYAVALAEDVPALLRDAAHVAGL
jgi:aminoglycoside phosphotransferase (APT) family kinase protein